MSLRHHFSSLDKNCFSDSNMLFEKYFGLTPVIPVLVSGMDEYDGRRGIKFSDAEYHVDEDVDVEVSLCRNTKKTEKQHRTER